MALSRFCGRGLTAIFQNTSNGRLGIRLQPGQRTFRLGEARLEKDTRDHIEVDKISKLALVVEGKYKSLADVPELLPKGTVSKARDKLRVKFSIASSVFLIVTCFILVKRNQRLKREVDYARLMQERESQ